MLWSGVYSIFTSDAFEATTPDMAFLKKAMSRNFTVQSSTENALPPWPVDVRYTSGQRPPKVGRRLEFVIPTERSAAEGPAGAIR
jgi:hypothetical protein